MFEALGRVGVSLQELRQELRSWCRRRPLQVAHVGAQDSLRSALLTESRNRCGIEAVRVVLGRFELTTTRLYAVRNEAEAFGNSASFVLKCHTR